MLILLQDTAIVSKTDADQPITAIDLRLLHKYMDVYSRPPDRSVGRFKLGTVQMQLAQKKTTARYLVAPQTEIRSTLQACLCRLHHRKSISGYGPGSRASTKTTFSLALSCVYWRSTRILKVPVLMHLDARRAHSCPVGHHQNAGPSTAFSGLL